MAPKREVVNLKLLHLAARLTAPVVALQHPLMQFGVG